MQIYSNEISICKSYLHPEAAQVTVIKIWSQPRGPSMDEENVECQSQRQICFLSLIWNLYQLIYKALKKLLCMSKMKNKRVRYCLRVASSICCIHSCPLSSNSCNNLTEDSQESYICRYFIRLHCYRFIYLKDRVT